ncbi:hypothetical protein PS876_04575 [Pseudomonas fluorescens]|uniref:4-oxalocrotonate tautomerase domain-containing protein n=1 Tax=Pseudomonas fluorescens TaxID=294 RepID=A0ABD7VCW3_PSEFL|nr:hypothetical protein [Pseudomonas fluorescens]VVO75394.1 hypothetical protein PS732_01545 [Pseudomonas fluorescens]VVP35633.1 hypothetical protein PS876_04575 [Pseudomonas fluorescens]
MTRHAILTVDLNGYVSEEARKTFERVLDAHHYVKRKLTTVWRVQFTPGTTAADAERIMREHVALAASTAGIRNYEALVMVGEQPPIEWKKDGVSTGLLAEALLQLR